MRQFFSALSFTAVLCFSSILSAQDTFTDAAEWEAAICGTIVSDDFEFDFVDSGAAITDIIDGTTTAGVIFQTNQYLYPAPQARPWGTIGTNGVSSASLDIFGNQVPFSGPSFIGSIDFVTSGANFDIQSQLDLNNSVPLVLTLDPAGGNLEGICIEYTGTPAITFFDGTTVVDTIIPATFIDANNDPLTTSTICWLNSGQVNVTSVEIVRPVSDPNFAVVTSVDFAFGDGCAPPAETCLSQLQDLIVDLGSIGPTGDSCDDQKIVCALWYLDCATHDSLWSDDDHVANCSFFYYVKKGNKYLSWVSDNAEVNQVLEDIQSVLSCVAENEIMAATAAGGDSNYLDWAGYYQDCADDFQAIGSYRKAAKFRKWAWLYAFWA